MPHEHVVHLQVEQPAARLDRFLARHLPELSRSQIQKLIRQGQVRLSTSEQNVPGQSVRPSTSLQAGNLVTLSLPQPNPETLQAEAVPLDILFEDKDLVVVNKPAGMVVHPAHGHPAGTLVNALLARYPDLVTLSQGETEASTRPGIVHRLDRDTSGLIVVARTSIALQQLRRQFKDRTVEKIYLALVFGRPETDQGVIDVPLGRDPRHRQKFAPLPDGKPARTRFRLHQNLGQYSLLEVGLETGRTHQIRVHLAWLDCPVVGDTVYGRRKNSLGLRRQFLHAWKLSFEHPRTGQRLTVEAPLGDDLLTILDRLGGYPPRKSLLSAAEE